MLIFGLHSTSNDQPSDPAVKVDQNVKKGPKSSKNEMLVFGLRPTFDDWPSILSDES